MIDATHDPALRSWVESANQPGVDFPIQNLPYGTYARKGEEHTRLGVAIGEMVLDAGAAFQIPSMEALMALPRSLQEEAMAVSDRIAVMSQGVVVQEGRADDLYHRPASAFVAQFIGRVNLLRGRVLERGADGVVVEAAGGRVRVAGDAGRAGEAVRLAIRPEALGIEADGPGAAGEIAGRVVARTFLGEKVDYQVRVGEETLLVTRPDPGPVALLAEGQAVRLRLPAERVSLLPATE